MVKKFLFMLVFFLSFSTITSAEVKLRVGYIPGTGFLEEDRGGHYSGYGYEYMEFLSRYGNWKFEYVPFSTWNECNEKLQSGAIDILPGMPGDYRALQNVIRTDHVVGRFPMELVTKDGKTKSEMKIGTIPANAPLPSLPKVAQSEGFGYELINYPLFYDMEDAYNRGEIDGYIASMTEPNKNQNVAAIFDRQSYRLLVRPDRKDLLDSLNVAMDEMLMDQPNIRNRLNEKYLRTGGFPLILIRPEKEYLAQKKKLTAAILMNDKPYAYYENGQIHGVIPHVIKQIADDLNIEIEIIKTNTAAEAAQLIKRGAVDFIADAVCDFSWAETLNMAPTQSYLQLDYVAINRRGENADDAQIVACAADLLYTKNFIYPQWSEDKRVYCQNLRECFKAVSEGQADILFAPRSEVPYIIEELGIYNLETASESSFSDSLSLGVYTGSDSRLWRILNKEINHLDTNKIRSSINADMSTSSHNLSLQRLIYHYPLQTLAAMIILLLLIAAAVRYQIYLRKQHMNRVQHMAYTDSKTQLPNLAWLENQIPALYPKLEESEENLYVTAFFVEDGNNSLKYSEELQIKLLKNIANQSSHNEEILLTAISDENTGVVCICKGKNSTEIARLARDIIRQCEYVETKDSRTLQYIRVGISEMAGDDLSKSLKQAQIAHKKSQKDVAIFNSQMKDEIDFEHNIETKMKDALQNGEFQAWYQAEFNIETHKSIGEEAFVRWQSSELGFLLPEKFIPLFERNGFITAVDYFILEEACRLQRKRLDDGKKILPISVNQSSLHLTEENYIEKMKNLLKKYDLPKGALKVEFSESAFEGINDSDKLKRVTGIMRSLQKIGFKISIDNFGSSYSSYKILNLLSIDEMKIDRSILYSAKNSKRMYDILENIIRLGNNLGMRVICEGIETHEQENLLIKLGCHYGQGFINADVTRDNSMTVN